MFPPDELLNYKKLKLEIKNNCREENVKRNNNILHVSHHVQSYIKIFPPS